MWIYQNSQLFVAMITQSIERKMYTFLIVGGDKSGIFDVGWLIGQYQKSTHLLPTDKPFCNWRLGVTDVSGGKRQSFPFKISVQIDWYAHLLWQSRPSPNPPPPPPLRFRCTYAASSCYIQQCLSHDPTTLWYFFFKASDQSFPIDS